MKKTKMITVIVVVVVVVVAAGFFFSRSGGVRDSAGTGLAGEVSLTLPGAQKTVDPDMSPPDFFVIREGKGETTLSELKGKPVFINFWNTWCPPCRDEMPELDELYREYDKVAEFIFINRTSQEKSPVDVTTFLSDNGYSIPVYLDRRGEVVGAYGLPGVPATVILNAQGEVIYAAVGPISYEKAKSLIRK